MLFIIKTINNLIHQQRIHNCRSSRYIQLYNKRSKHNFYLPNERTT